MVQPYVTTNLGCCHATALAACRCAVHLKKNAAGFSVVTSKKGSKRKLQKPKSYPNSSSDELSNSKKKAATTQLRPVILQANLGDKGCRPLAFSILSQLIGV